VCRGTDGRLCARDRWDWDWRGPQNEELAQVMPKEGGVFGRKDFAGVEQCLELGSKGRRKDGEDIVVECVEGAKDGADEFGWDVDIVVDHISKDGEEEAARVGGATVSSGEDDVADCYDILDPQLDQGFSGGFRVLRLLTFR
jgi:hypothetical protein